MSTINKSGSSDSFSKGISNAKHKVSNRIFHKIDEAKLDIIKQALTERNIPFDNNIDNLNELKRKVINKLNLIKKREINMVIDNTTNELQKVISELKSGSTTAFSKFVSKAYTNLIKPISKGSAISLASRTALILAPNIEYKLLIGAGIVGNTLYKLSKNNKYKIIANQSYECNKILRELEITKDDSGNIIDTRFSKTIQDEILKFFAKNNVKMNNTGYLELIECVYNLKLDKKIALANIINNEMGNPIEVNERIKKYDKSIIKKIKNNIVLPIVASAGLGSSIAVGISVSDPSWIAAPANGTAIGLLVAKLTNSPVMGWISGILGAGGTAALQYIPVVGVISDNVLANENIIILGTLGAIVGVFGVVGTKIYSVVKNTSDFFKRQKEEKKIKKIDTGLYSADNNNEKGMINLLKEKGPTDEELAIINITNAYMKEKGIELNKEIDSISSLKSLINNSNEAKKKELLKLVGYLEEYRTRDPNGFRRIMNKIGSSIYWSSIFGLAGLSIWDIISGGEILTQISEQMFKDVPGVLKKTDLVIERASEPIESTPKPATTKSILTPRPAPSPAPIRTPVRPTTPTPTPSVTLMPTTNDLHNLLTNSNEFIKSIAQMPVEEIYSHISKIGNEDIIKSFIESIPKQTVVDLVKYINNTKELGGSVLTQSFMIDSLNEQVIKINGYVDAFRNITETTANNLVPIIGTVNSIDESNKVKRRKHFNS